MLNIEKYKDEIKEKICECTTLIAINDLYFDKMNRYEGIFKSLDWLCEEYKEQILTVSEREYLKAVFKPFHKRIEFISKVEDGDGESLDYMYDEEHSAWLPTFEKGTMYKNMELYKGYTLEELGITYDD